MIDEEKEEWINRQIAEYRNNLEREWGLYTGRNSKLSKWVEEYKDIDPDMCMLVEYLLNKMMTTGDGEMRKKCWTSILVLCKDLDEWPIRRGR